MVVEVKAHNEWLQREEKITEFQSWAKAKVYFEFKHFYSHFACMTVVDKKQQETLERVKKESGDI